VRYLESYSSLSDIDKFVNYCKNTLDLNHRLSDEYYYNSITSSIIDAVYSLGITYAQTRKVVNRYNEYYDLKEFRENGSDYYPISEQESVSDLINRINGVGVEYMASDIFKNRCRTSTHKSSILKSEAVLMFANVLKKYGVNYFQDIHIVINDTNFENDIKKIPGQTTGISIEYFYMLVGKDNFVKIDRHMIRFFYDSIGYHQNKYGVNNGKYIVSVIRKSIDILKKNIVILHLDY